MRASKHLATALGGQSDYDLDARRKPSVNGRHGRRRMQKAVTRKQRRQDKRAWLAEAHSHAVGTP